MKEYRFCSCGCGEKIRYYPARPQKFCNRNHYLVFNNKVKAFFEHENAILSPSRRKKQDVTAP